MYWSDISITSEQYTYEYFLQEDVCRLCWSKNAEHEITSNSTENSSIVNKIKDCLNIEVNSDQPNKLCAYCVKEIEKFYDYKKFCIETDSKLRDILKNGFVEPKTEYNDDHFDNTDTEDCGVIITAKKTDKTVKKTEKTVKKRDKTVKKTDKTVKKSEKTVKKRDKTVKKTDKTVKNDTKIRKKHNKRTPTYCNICCIDLESETNLSTHNSQLHGIENDGTLFKCFGCEKRFKSRKTRISHEIHFCKGLKDGYKCDICERYLPKRCMYEFHMRDHRHNTITELPEQLFRCGLGKCNKLFKTNELLKNHMTEHAKEKNFVCDVCGRVFSRKDYLHKHQLTHAGIKQHECPHCEFRATQRSSLIVHIRKHTGDRPYSCDLCPRRCVSSSNLRAHRRRHLGDKRYECTICNKKFGYKISLREHVSSKHMGSVVHPCEQCDATYTQIRGLRHHLATKHGKQKDKEQIAAPNTEIATTMELGTEILKNVEYELKDDENMLLLKHQEGDVFMV